VPFSIDIQNLAPLLKALDSYPDIAGPILQDAAEAGLLSTIPDLATYPPARANSTYRRTGTLGRLWTAARPEWQAMTSGFEASIGNATPYGVWVQDSDMQAGMHQNRWTTDQDAVEKRTVEIDRYFERALQDIADAIERQAS
jgi:hypothetical protein